MNKYYAGIGSRECPKKVLDQMTELAIQLEKMGWWLRSGNAYGADQAFALGVEENAQIWLPWNSFGDAFRLIRPYHTYKVIQNNDEEAEKSVYLFHPAPEKLSRGAMALMKRNHRQLKGLNEPDSSFVICWTKDGKDSGGTGQNIRAAKHWGIPIFNLFNLTPEEILTMIPK